MNDHLLTVLAILAGSATTAFLQWWTARQASRQRQYLGRQTQKELVAIKNTTEITHSIVNSARSLLLHDLANVQRRLADLTQLPMDIRAAEQAALNANEHESRQQRADGIGLSSVVARPISKISVDVADPHSPEGVPG